jgi:integrase
MGVTIRVKNGKLYLDMYGKGKRVWEALHLSVSTNKAQNKEVMRLAEACRSKREIQLVSREWEVLDPVGAKKTLLSYVKEMAADRTPQDRLVKVQEYIKRYPGGTTIRLDKITDRWFRDFQSYLLKTPELSTTTANSYESALRYIFNLAVRDNLIPKSPAALVKSIKIPEPAKVHLSPDEMQRIADMPVQGELGPEIRKAFLFACYTGLRVSDIKSLTWGDIEQSSLQIIKRQKKTAAQAYVPLHETAWQLINDDITHAPTDLVFPRFGAVKDACNKYLIRWEAKIGLGKKIGWHTARHTAAVLLLEGGADIYTVSKLLGHTSIKTTAVYAKATDRLRREAVTGLPKIAIDTAINKE